MYGTHLSVGVLVHLLSVRCMLKNLCLKLSACFANNSTHREHEWHDIKLVCLDLKYGPKVCGHNEHVWYISIQSCLTSCVRMRVCPMIQRQMENRDEAEYHRKMWIITYLNNLTNNELYWIIETKYQLDWLSIKHKEKPFSWILFKLFSWTYLK